MSSPEALSAGPSTLPNYSSGPSTPPSYSSGLSTPPNYSSQSSRNAECSNCKHLRGKISVLKATMNMRNERFLNVSYNQILKATDGLSIANLLGEGGFSSGYKGILDSNGDKFVAVKVLNLQNQGAHKSFLAECEAWRNIRHPALGPYWRANESLVSFFDCSTTVSASYGGNETDSHTLLSFKSKITKDPYQVLSSWNHSFHFCDWNGVSCGKQHKRVTAVELSSKGLEGSLSPHVGNLSFLRKFDLWNNSFQGTIPHELGRLSRLRILYLDTNKFSGVIPTNLSGCSNLKELFLARNKLAGSIPNEMSLLSKVSVLAIDDNKLIDTLGHWKSLTAFYCGDCNLYGSIPPSIFNLSLLVRFSLADNHLTGSLPSEIGNQLPNLEFLQLRDNELTGVLPPSLSNCSKLGFFEMSSNNFSGKLTIDFSKLIDIYRIYILNNNFHGRGEADDMKFIDSLKTAPDYEIKDLKLLSDLDLSYNNLSGNITSSLGECISLTESYLSGNIFQGIIPSSLSSLRGLEVLDLYQNNISGNIPQFLEEWKSLNYLNLSFNDFEGEVPVAGVFSNAKFIFGFGEQQAIRWFGYTWVTQMQGDKKSNSQPFQSSGNERFLKVSYNQLLKAIDGLSAKNLIGEGGFSSVYKEINVKHGGIFNIEGITRSYIDGDTIVLQSTQADAKKVEECLVATMKIGVSCYVDSPSQRMKLKWLSLSCSVFSMCFKIYKVYPHACMVKLRVTATRSSS
nr:protein kinase-like domain-containing protein [Tanacetum cinerariifolium]